MDSGERSVSRMLTQISRSPKFVDIRSKYEFSWKQEADGWLQSSTSCVPFFAKILDLE